jgi:hypothetical protein
MLKFGTWHLGFLKSTKVQGPKTKTVSMDPGHLEDSRLEDSALPEL